MERAENFVRIAMMKITLGAIACGYINFLPHAIFKQPFSVIL